MPDNWHKFSVQTASSFDTGLLNGNTLKLGALANNPGQAADYTAAFATRLDGSESGIDFALHLGVLGTAVLTVTQINNTLLAFGYPPLVNTYINPNLPTNAEIAGGMPNTNVQAKYWAETPSFDVIGLKAHGIELYKEFPGKFYNSYLPYHYGSDKLRTPEDTGKFFLPFNFYPGTYQPSGHINVSRAREFYFSYSSSTITNVNNAEVFFMGTAINFLLISDGSAILRYST